MDFFFLRTHPTDTRTHSCSGIRFFRGARQKLEETLWDRQIVLFQNYYIPTKTIIMIQSLLHQYHYGLTESGIISYLYDRFGKQHKGSNVFNYSQLDITS